MDSGDPTAAAAANTPDVAMVRDGYVDELECASFYLVRKDFPPEVQRHGFKMLRHLLKFRREELNISIWRKFLNAVNLTEAPVGPDITEDEVLALEDAFSNIINSKELTQHTRSLPVLATCHSLQASVEKSKNVIRKVAGGGGNQDGDAVNPTTASNLTSSPQTCFLSLGQRPWALKGGRMGLSVALACLQDPPDVCPSPNSYSASRSTKFTSFLGLFGRRSTHEGQLYRIDPTLNRNNLDHNILADPRLLHLSFPINGPVPISWLGLGAKSQNGSGDKRLSFSLGNAGSGESSGSSILELPTSITPASQVDDDKFGIQSLAADMFDCGEDDGGGCGNGQDVNGGQDNVTDDLEEFTEFVDPIKSGVCRTMYRDQGKGCRLLGEHNLLSEAFVILASSPGIQQDKEVLTCLLKPLNKIWTQSEWEDEYMHYTSGLTRLFSDSHFIKMVHGMVTFFEDQLKRRTKESTATLQICSSALTTNQCPVALLALILPTLLRLLQCIHALWVAEVANVMPEEIDDWSYKKDLTKNEITEREEKRELLQGIRKSGYNFIGLCASIEGEFFELVDSSAISVTLMEDLDSMECQYIGQLINHAFIPLVKHCPCKLWKEWMVNVWVPLFDQCERMLHFLWFQLLYDGRTKAPYYFGNLFGSAEVVRKSEEKLLLDFTRAVSNLLGAFALPELNNGPLHRDRRHSSNSNIALLQDLESISSNTLVGYLLCHRCLGMFRMSLFGYLVDGHAAKEAIPFCRALVHLAVATNDERLNRFVLNDLLPVVIQRVNHQLPCAINRVIQRLGLTVDVRNDLVFLLQDIYNYMAGRDSVQRQDLVGGDKVSDNTANGFEGWFAKQMSDLHAKIESVAPKKFPEEFVWNWEFEDEFRRYLPAYIDMLLEVDAMGDHLKIDSLFQETLFEQLKPEFKLKYAIYSCHHPHVQTMCRMIQRKFPAQYQQREKERSYEFISKLITAKPPVYCWIGDYEIDNAQYCKLLANLTTAKPCFEFSSVSDVMYCLEEDYGADVARKINVFRAILFYWEPQFHPLIREGHKDILLNITRQLTFAEHNECYEAFQPDPADFFNHLWPYAWTYINTKKEEFEIDRLWEQARLHEKFDICLASGQLDCYMNPSSLSKDDFVKKVVDSSFEQGQFANLNRELIMLSFERRAIIVNRQVQIDCYSKCLRDLLENKMLKVDLNSLMSELEVEGFFNIDDDSVNWKKKCFSELVDKFDAKVFTGHALPKYDVIRGIIDYWEISQMKDVTWEEAFERVVVRACSRWRKYLPQFWMDSRYYEHAHYDILRRPLKKM